MTNRQIGEAHWLRSHGQGWLDIYWSSCAQPWREPLMEALRTVAPYKTVLDIGSNCGAIAPLILTASYDAHITGVDLSVDAIEYAKRLFPKHRWQAGSVIEWLAANTQTFEIVTSSGVLGHIAPEDIDFVLTHISTIATRAIVLQQRVISPNYPREEQMPTHVTEWRYDYVGRLFRLGWHLSWAKWRDWDTPQPGGVMVFTRGRHQ